MRERTCCFTGHRKLPEGRGEEIAVQLETAILALVQDGYRYFGAGGALGFDTLAAQAVLRLRPRYPQIKLILVLPCVYLETASGGTAYTVDYAKKCGLRIVNLAVG